jgi:DNA-binding NtrC family response regulator
MGRILIVEDDKGTREALGSALAVEGHDILQAVNGREGLRMAVEADVDVVVSDMRMPEMDGLSLLEGLKKEKPDVEVIVVTAYGTVETAVTAMKKGAYDFIEKPIRDLGEIRELVRKAFEKRTLVRENVSLREQLRDKYRFDNIVGNSPRIAEVFQVVAQVAPTQATVLVTGESGTGKELIANAIHYNSLRAGKPFIKVNCASLSETLLESELFGHERGAFTGAVAQRSGRFEIADGGTLFLDEIGTLSPTVQVKLLRVLQEREFERVGGNKPIKVDVRLVVATNRDLGAAVERGEFREDLYYRVNVVKIALPALRERKEDIPLLVAHFISKYSAKNNRNVTGVTDEALELLRAYDYPGNIRELENIIENAVVLTSTPKVTPEVLPAGLRKDAKKSGLISIPVGTDFKEIEKQVIKATLAHTNNNKTRAAAVLGIGVRTLHRKMEQYGLRD